MSSRMVAGANDIPLVDLHHGHENSSTLPASTEAPPPAYNSDAVQLPDYNHPHSSPPSITGKPPITHKHRRVYLIAILIGVIILGVVLGKTLSYRNKRNNNAFTILTPKSSSNPKVFGLAAAECDAGTFVVWKVASGHFWWKGALKDSAGGGEIPFQLLQQEGNVNYTRPGSFADLTASCWWEIKTGSRDIVFQFIYYDRHVFRTFVSTNIVIAPFANVTAEGVKPTISLATIRKFDREIEYNITSLAVAYTTPFNESPIVSRNHLIYLVPRDLSKPNGTADVVLRSTIGSMWGWEDPQILPGTAMNARSGIAIASVDGGIYNGNKTEIHIVFGGEEGNLMYMNWTLSGNWSSAVDIRDSDGKRFQTPPSPFTLAIPSASTTRSQWDAPFSSEHTRLNLYWITDDTPDFRSSFGGAVPIVNYASVSYSPSDNQIRTPGGVGLEQFGINSSLALANPGYIVATAYNPMPSKNLTTINEAFKNQTLETDLALWQQQESARYERVQLFFVEADVNVSQGGRIANYTYQKTRGIYGWLWEDGAVVQDVGKDLEGEWAE